jgi:hypothetical protein
VAGAWAVLKHADPGGTVNEFEGLLKSVGPSVTSRNTLWVKKRLDVQSALQILAPSVNVIAPPVFLLTK